MEEEGKTVFSVENYDKTIIIKRPTGDVTINEFVEDFVSLMIGITFYEDQIINALKEYIENRE